LTLDVQSEAGLAVAFVLDVPRLTLYAFVLVTFVLLGSLFSPGSSELEFPFSVESVVPMLKKGERYFYYFVLLICWCTKVDDDDMHIGLDTYVHKYLCRV
jgi:hypothetical protein